MESQHADLQPLMVKPKLRLTPVIFFAACALGLGSVSYFRPEPDRAFYGGLGALLVVTLVLQYRKETTLLRNFLLSTATVTKYFVRGRHAPYLGKGVPIITYEFVAFDQKTYHGETGWGAKGLQEGSHVNILYNPENPASSHPVRGFVFYSFS